MERCVADPCCSTASLGVAQRAGCPQRPGRRPLQPLAAMPDRRSGSGLRAQRGSHLFEQPALATATEPVPSASLLGASRTTLIHTAGRKHSKLRVAVDVDEGEQPGQGRAGGRPRNNAVRRGRPLHSALPGPAQR